MFPYVPAWSLLYLDLQESETVAKKARNNMPNMEFESVYFDREERDACVSWVDQRTWDWVDCLVSIAESNLKLSVSYDLSQEVYIISVTIKSTPKSEPMFCYMFRHADMARALQMAHYYCVEVIDFGNNPIGTDDRYSW